ncbi:MAG: hypothetical protein AAB589_01900 [Patescibacteria group bacterium]
MGHSEGVLGVFHLDSSYFGVMGCIAVAIALAVIVAGRVFDKRRD